MATTIAPEGATAGTSGATTTESSGATPGTLGRPGPLGTPLAGDAILDRLRLAGRSRPAVDPSLAADLVDAVEEGLADLGIGPGRLPGLEQRLALAWAPGTPDPWADLHDAAPGGRLLVTPDRLRRALACPDHRDGVGSAARPWSLPLAVGALVGALFAQLVATGTVDDPMTDGLAALALDDHQTPLVAWIAELPPHEHAELAAEVARQASALRARWPRLDPAWLPRTREVVRTGLAGGAVELLARVDLALGQPARDVSSVALVDVVTGPRRAEHPADRAFAALVETVRTGAAPFATATYATRSGELDVDPVTPELLVGAARRLLAGVGELVARVLGRTPPGAEPVAALPVGHGCPGCATGSVRSLVRTTARPVLHVPPAAEPAARRGEPEADGPAGPGADDPGAPTIPGAPGATTRDARWEEAA